MIKIEHYNYKTIDQNWFYKPVGYFLLVFNKSNQVLGLFSTDKYNCPTLLKSKKCVKQIPFIFIEGLLIAENAHLLNLEHNVLLNLVNGDPDSMKKFLSELSKINNINYLKV